MIESLEQVLAISAVLLALHCIGLARQRIRLERRRRDALARDIERRIGAR